MIPSYACLLVMYKHPAIEVRLKICNMLCMTMSKIVLESKGREGQGPHWWSGSLSYGSQAPDYTVISLFKLSDFSTSHSFDFRSGTNRYSLMGSQGEPVGDYLESRIVRGERMRPIIHLLLHGINWEKNKWWITVYCIKKKTSR
jgi:hypothetical protein